jgi:hypothetical protein
MDQPTHVTHVSIEIALFNQVINTMAQLPYSQVGPLMDEIRQKAVQTTAPVTVPPDKDD